MESYGHHKIVALDELQTEHISPQTLTDDWRATRGEGAERVDLR